MYITSVYMDTQMAQNFEQGDCDEIRNEDKVYCKYKDHIIPVFFKIGISPCPAGFRPSNDEQSCDCYFCDRLFNICSIVNGIGYFSWSKVLWVSIEEDALIYSTLCPFGYCKVSTGEAINLQNDSNSQCAFS